VQPSVDSAVQPSVDSAALWTAGTQPSVDSAVQLSVDSDSRGRSIQRGKGSKERRLRAEGRAIRAAAEAPTTSADASPVAAATPTASEAQRNYFAAGASTTAAEAPTAADDVSPARAEAPTSQVAAAIAHTGLLFDTGADISICTPCDPGDAGVFHNRVSRKLDRWFAKLTQYPQALITHSSIRAGPSLFDGVERSVLQVLSDRSRYPVPPALAGGSYPTEAPTEPPTKSVEYVRNIQLLSAAKHAPCLRYHFDLPKPRGCGLGYERESVITVVAGAVRDALYCNQWLREAPTALEKSYTMDLSHNLNYPLVYGRGLQLFRVDDIAHCLLVDPSGKVICYGSTVVTTESYTGCGDRLEFDALSYPSSWSNIRLPIERKGAGYVISSSADVTDLLPAHRLLLFRERNSHQQCGSTG
jgi:hypothetical protein